MLCLDSCLLSLYLDAGYIKLDSLLSLGVVNKLMPIVPLSTPAVCMVRSDHARNQQKHFGFNYFFKEHVCVLRECGRVIGPLISNSLL